ncbi:lasso peptide biosynthesis PqqD family chaperone [Actinomycetes bacterium KLBMP 9797]
MDWRLRSGVLVTDTEYGAALLDEDSGIYWTLNDTAAVVVRALAGGGGADAAAGALRHAYDVDPTTARSDVSDLLDALDAAGLVER